MAKTEFEKFIQSKKDFSDWHYDPSVKSSDVLYVGKIEDDISSCINGINFVEFEHDKKPSAYSNTVSREKWIEKIPSVHWPSDSSQRFGYHDLNTRHAHARSFKEENIPPSLGGLTEICYDIADSTGLENPFCQIFKQPPGNFNPLHFDTCAAVISKNEVPDDRIKEIRRYLIFIEDWHWGHFLQIGNNVVTNWKSGDVYTWDFGMYHLSANAGIVDKYTMQITGLPQKDAWHLKNKKSFKIKKGI